MKFLIVIAVWGEKFISQMCEICLPCLLAPNNLPAIPPAERFRFIFLTRQEDISRIKEEAVVRQLEKFIPTEFLVFDPSQYKSPHLALSGAHRMALLLAAKEKAHFVLLDPDIVFSDGTLAAARRMAANGKAAVMVSGLRLTSETAVPALISRKSSKVGFDNSILQPRELMKFAMSHFHPEVPRYFYDSRNFTRYPMVCLWPVKDEGLLDRSFQLHPLVLDMGRARSKAFKTLDYDTIDGVFVSHAFRDKRQVYVEQDSDNMLVFSFTSENEYREAPTSHSGSAKMLRTVVYKSNINSLHRSMFGHAIKLHVGDLSAEWDAVERKTAGILREVRSSVLEVKSWIFSDHRSVAQVITKWFIKVTDKVRTLRRMRIAAMRFFLLVEVCWARREIIGVKLMKATHDASARQRVRRRIHQGVGFVLLGHVPDETGDVESADHSSLG